MKHVHGVLGLEVLVLYTQPQILNIQIRNILTSYDIIQINLLFI
jgi:hypothetical protein